MEASHRLQATELRESYYTLAKLCRETQLSWVNMLPLALLRAWCTLRSLGYILPLRSYMGEGTW